MEICLCLKADKKSTAAVSSPVRPKRRSATNPPSTPGDGRSGAHSERRTTSGLTYTTSETQSLTITSSGCRSRTTQAVSWPLATQSFTAIGFPKGSSNQTAACHLCSPGALVSCPRLPTSPSVRGESVLSRPPIPLFAPTLSATRTCRRQASRPHPTNQFHVPVHWCPLNLQ